MRHHVKIYFVCFQPPPTPPSRRQLPGSSSHHHQRIQSRVVKIQQKNSVQRQLKQSCSKSKSTKPAGPQSQCQGKAYLNVTVYFT